MTKNIVIVIWLCIQPSSLILEALSLQEIMNGNLERETYIGHEAQHMRGVLALKHPIKNGIIRNWDEMEKVSGNAYT